MHQAFRNLFFQGSLPGPDFFHDHFFRRRMEMNGRYRQDLMLRVDPLKNDFFQRPERPRNAEAGPVE